MKIRVKHIDTQTKNIYAQKTLYKLYFQYQIGW